MPLFNKLRFFSFSFFLLFFLLAFLLHSFVVFSRGSLHPGRSKVTRVTVRRDTTATSTKGLEIAKLILRP